MIEAALAALLARYDARFTEIQAAIGPSIGGCCYAFGAEHRAAFTARFGADAEKAWRDDPADATQSYLDLRLICRLALERAGVPSGGIAELGPCTADHPNELHSYRRDGAYAGRQLSYVGWSS